MGDCQRERAMATEKDSEEGDETPPRSRIRNDSGPSWRKRSRGWSCERARQRSRENSSRREGSAGEDEECS